jgi:hypothetical protein
MNLYLVMKLLHFLAAFWFISGIVGQNLAFWQQSDGRPGGSCIVAVSDFFERYAVIPVGSVVLEFGLIIKHAVKVIIPMIRIASVFFMGDPENPFNFNTQEGSSRLIYIQH